MLAPPALRLARTEQPLCALLGSSSCSTISPSVFSSCARDAEAAFHSFGWSDMPCQGDYFVDSPQEELNRLATSLSDYQLPPSPPHSPPPDSQEENEISLSPPPSPTSTARYADLDDVSVRSKAASAKAAALAERKRKVRFASALEVRTYEVILGDHPGCRGGMALQCGWRYSEPELVDLDVHEEHSPHRRMHELRLSFYARRDRLQEVTGMSGSELLQAEYAICCEQQQEQKQFGCMMPTVLRRATTMKMEGII